MKNYKRLIRKDVKRICRDLFYYAIPYFSRQTRKYSKTVRPGRDAKPGPPDYEAGVLTAAAQN
jgi:hypothetical protein